MNKMMTFGAAVLFSALLVINSTHPAKASEADKKMCLETINELTGGKPPAESVKLCEQGKSEAALEAAMNAGSGG